MQGGYASRHRGKRQQFSNLLPSYCSSPNILSFPNLTQQRAALVTALLSFLLWDPLLSPWSDPCTFLLARPLFFSPVLCSLLCALSCSGLLYFSPALGSFLIWARSFPLLWAPVTFCSGLLLQSPRQDSCAGFCSGRLAWALSMVAASSGCAKSGGRCGALLLAEEPLAISHIPPAPPLTGEPGRPGACQSWGGTPTFLIRAKGCRPAPRTRPGRAAGTRPGAALELRVLGPRPEPEPPLCPAPRSFLCATAGSFAPGAHEMEEFLQRAKSKLVS